MNNISFISLLMNAALPVKIIIAILAICSFVSWTIMFYKWFLIKYIKYGIRRFAKQFFKTTSINVLFGEIANTKKSGNAKIFFIAISEYNKMQKNTITDRNIIIDNIHRVVDSAIEQELATIDSQLSTLASFATVSPYIGLLGTVFGIIHTFIGLGDASQVTLSVVAPGIAEALLATAMGLIIAIPAYIGYNHFISDTIALERKMRVFGDELINLINRKIV